MSNQKHLSPITGKMERCSSPNNCRYGGGPGAHLSEGMSLNSLIPDELAEYEAERRQEFFEKGYTNPVPVEAPEGWDEQDRQEFYNLQSEYLNVAPVSSVSTVTRDDLGRVVDDDSADIPHGVPAHAYMTPEEADTKLQEDNAKRAERYSSENVEKAGRKALEAIDTAAEVRGNISSRDMQNILLSTMSEIDTKDREDQVSIAADYSQRYSKTVGSGSIGSPIENLTKRKRLAKLVTAQTLMTFKDKSLNELNRQIEEAAERNSAREKNRKSTLSYYSPNEMANADAMESVNRGLAETGLFEQRKNAADRYDQPYTEDYRDDEGRVYAARQMKLPAATEGFLKARGFPVQNIYELDGADKRAAQLYQKAALKSKEGNKFHASLTVYDAEDYENQRIFLSEDRESGFVLSKSEDSDTHDEIVSVFSTEDAPKGASYQMMSQAVAEGGSKLDCYNTVLPRIYSGFGFKETEFLEWDDQYKPDDWDYETYSKYNNGRPGVVMMEYSDGYEHPRSTKDLRTTEEKRENLNPAESQSLPAMSTS